MNKLICGLEILVKNEWNDNSLPRGVYVCMGYT